MEIDFRSYFEGAHSILILLPQRPYFDQVAAGLSLYLALVGKKEVNIVSPEPMLVEFNRLVGVDKVTDKVDNKNLLIKFAGYNAGDIEKVSSEIKGEELYLYVIPKAEALPPRKEQIEISYLGIAADLIILVGGANESHFPLALNEDLSSLPKIHLGIKKLSWSKGEEPLSWVKNCSSVSELVADLIRETGLEIDADIASNLIAGIEAGSNHYQSEGVSANTFQIIADLMHLGGQRPPQLIQKKYPLGAVPTARQAVRELSPLKSPQNGEQRKENQTPPSDWLAPKIFKTTVDEK